MDVGSVGSKTSSEAYSFQSSVGQSDFLQILSAQMQYQDPLEGLDSTQYVSQLAQFSSLEQMQNLNSSFALLIERQDLLLVSQWIGKEVTAIDEEEEMITGVVDGFRVKEGEIYFLIDDNEYSLNKVQINAIKDAPKEKEYIVINENQEEESTNPEEV